MLFGPIPETLKPKKNRHDPPLPSWPTSLQHNSASAEDPHRLRGAFFCFCYNLAIPRNPISIIKIRGLHSGVKLSHASTLRLRRCRMQSWFRVHRFRPEGQFCEERPKLYQLKSRSFLPNTWDPYPIIQPTPLVVFPTRASGSGGFSAFRERQQRV